MTDLDLRQLRVFVAVAEERGFTHGAARLRLSQPTVSRTVAALERALGVALFRRSTHSCVPTPAGEVLLAQARKVIESADRAARLTQRAAASAPRLVVAAKPDSDAGLLPAILDSYQSDPACPPAELLFQDTHELAAMVRCGRADVALIVGPGDREGLDTDELWAERRVVVLPAGHPLTGRETIALADLGDEPTVRWPAVPSQLDRYYRGLDQSPASQRGPDGPSAGNLLEALRLAELGRGVTYLPQSVAARFERPGITTRPVTGLSGSTAVAAWRAGSRDRAVSAFVRAAFQVAASAASRAC